ncbi:hypothetical protein Aduo_001771 [Ancylostoma duodenale]
MKRQHITWDEASMIPGKALETVDDLLRDIMQNESLFGGKTIVIVIGGNFRQVLPWYSGETERILWMHASKPPFCDRSIAPFN